MNINYFMNEALKEANKALKFKEVPIGAVLVDNNTKKNRNATVLIVFAINLSSKELVKNHPYRPDINSRGSFEIHHPYFWSIQRHRSTHVILTYPPMSVLITIHNFLAPPEIAYLYYIFHSVIEYVF